MPARTNQTQPDASGPADLPLPDLFGFVPPAPPATPSGRSTAKAAAVAVGWPATNADRPPAASARPSAGDRPLASPQAPLSGDYRRSGASLRRSDGRALTICLSTRPGRPPRYVRTVAPGSALRYCGSLFADRCTGRCDLDGAEFQDGDDRTRYAIRQAGPDLYRVAVASRRRRGRGRS